jgi:hypothetical protein
MAVVKGSSGTGVEGPVCLALEKSSERDWDSLIRVITFFEQTVLNLLSDCAQLSGSNCIGIQCPRRPVFERLRRRLRPAKPARPAADDEHPIEPRIQALNRAGEVCDMGLGSH